MSFIHVRNVTKYYGNVDSLTYALKNVSLDINDHEFVAIMGPSGSGKSTLLHILGCLDTQSEGDYKLDGVSPKQLNKSEQAIIRNQKIGFVFQQFALISEFTALENVQLPLQFHNMYTKGNGKISRSKMKELALEKLASVGLLDQAFKYPAQLSGGQQQRTAIARALVTNPNLVIADEPTGSLDQATGKEVMTLLTNIHREGKTVIIVTHDEQVAKYCNRIIKIRDGEITSDIVRNEKEIYHV